MKNKETILITGASSGIGRATAIKLAKEGYHVFAGVRKKVDKILLEELNPDITGVYIDITNPASIEKAFYFVSGKTDKIDVLINNAGIVVASPVELLTKEKFDEQFAVNTFGPINVAQRFLPLLKNGKIINISSMAASGIFPFISAYCASKRALDIFFNSFALENKDNIKVVSIKPAVVRTPIWDKSVNSAQKFLNSQKMKKIEKYEPELNALTKNATANNTKGISVDEVVNIVLKAVKSKNPKPSYNVGVQAFVADFVSKLPQSIINKLIKLKLNRLKP